MATGSRKARLTDIRDLALALPEVTESDGERPAYAVRGKTFAWFREPRKDALDPDTGERMDDVIGVHVPELGDKDALVQGPGPWFTTPHFNGYKAVLVRERDIGALTRDELAEVLTDAWASRAPKRLVKEYLDGQASSSPSST
jgi:hypothetical protein